MSMLNSASALRVAHHCSGLVWIGDGRGAACVVDYVENATGPVLGVEEDGEQILQARRREGGGDLERVRGIDVHALIEGFVEEAVAAHTVSAEAGYAVGDLEGGPAVDTGGLHPCGLVWRVVGHLVLKEDGRATIPVPDHFVFLVVLDKKSVGGDVVAVDDDAGVGSVDSPTHAVAVVGAPRPDVVEDYIAAVDHQAVGRAARGCAADAEEYVGKN